MKLSFLKAFAGSLAAVVGVLTAFWIGYQMGFSRAEDTQTTRQDEPCANANEVLLHSAIGSTDQRAKSAMDLLNKKGCRISAIRAVDSSHAALRYFHKPDSHDAILISNFLLAETEMQLPVQFLPRYASEVPPGTVEIWLP